MPKKLNIQFGPISESNIEQVRLFGVYGNGICFLLDREISIGFSLDKFKLRRINTVVFPIQYNEGFYQDILKRNNEELNKFAYSNEFVIGAVCARVEDMDLTSGKKRMYIMTLAVLAAYRDRGIGSELLQSLLDYCTKQQSTGQGDSKISEIALHVHISNDDAIRFYTEKFGFTLGPIVENYYRRIDPPHCYLLHKSLDQPMT
jgi:N-alpha-acetyltransferase 50